MEDGFGGVDETVGFWESGKVTKGAWDRKRLLHLAHFYFVCKTDFKTLDVLHRETDRKPEFSARNVLKRETSLSRLTQKR